MIDLEALLAKAVRATGAEKVDITVYEDGPVSVVWRLPIQSWDKPIDWRHASGDSLEGALRAVLDGNTLVSLPPPGEER